MNTINTPSNSSRNDTGNDKDLYLYTHIYTHVDNTIITNNKSSFSSRSSNGIRDNNASHAVTIPILCMYTYRLHSLSA